MYVQTLKYQAKRGLSFTVEWQEGERLTLLQAGYSCEQIDGYLTPQLYISMQTALVKHLNLVARSHYLNQRGQ